MGDSTRIPFFWLEYGVYGEIPIGNGLTVKTSHYRCRQATKAFELISMSTRL